MYLKKISEKRQEIGQGSNHGHDFMEVYKCPCGNGKVFYEDVDMTGHKNKNISCDCHACSETYTFGRGIATVK